ncbi:MarR family winged helix-turn-helix transcriptional regulator [Prosthecodimorpha staleyi]|uniref:MarR family transcriptional regulator n=1 Tax=Prosthecodimorpha staleyi TaxID=2840188 RepID=A0A947D5P1_9HYPH|nr:MarR family transcriptional regulator [Prosthecodimorpha staleyi]MBT9290798.1 MarR family transcriptional regulator [Prosthecodimorpha staleyi]
MISEMPADPSIGAPPQPICGLPAPGSAEESIAVILSDVTRLFWRRLECALKAAGYDFTAAEARTLVSIARLEGARQAALAETMRIEPMTLVGFLDRLEARGLIRRLPDPADRRAKLIRTTPEAAPTVARLIEIGAAVKAEVTAGFAESEVDALRDLLRRIRTNLDGLGSDRGASAA